MKNTREFLSLIHGLNRKQLINTARRLVANACEATDDVLRAAIIADRDEGRRASIDPYLAERAARRVADARQFEMFAS